MSGAYTHPRASIAFLASHPGRTLAHQAPWIGLLGREVRQAVREGFVLEGSLGTPGYDLTAACALDAGAHLRLNLLPEHQALLLTLKKTWPACDARLSIRPITTSRARPDPQDRDRQVLTEADRVVGVAIRRGGRLEQLLLERHRQGLPVEVCLPPGAWADALDEPLATSEKSYLARDFDPLQSAHPRLLDAGIPPRRGPPPDDGDLQLTPASSASEAQDGPLEGFVLPPGCPYALYHASPLTGKTLLHTTRATTGPWPDQSHWDFVRALAAGQRDADRRIGSVLTHILEEGRIRGSGKLLPSGRPMVCLSAAPVEALATRQVFRPHLARWDALPFGLVFRLEALQALGAQPVQYLSPTEIEELKGEARLYVQRHQPPRCDWSHEQEWRLPGDLHLGSLDPADVRILLPDSVGTALDTPGRASRRLGS